MDQQKRAGFFQFNLLPPKSEAQVILEEERNDSLVYAIILVFASLVIYLGVILAQSAVIEPRLESLQQAKVVRQNRLDQYQAIREINGELFIKTTTLESVLEKDLPAEEIFRVASEISNVSDDVGVLSYIRESGGLFVFDFVVTEADDAVDILNQAEQVEGVSDIFLRNLSSQTGGRVRVSLELNINSIQ